MVGLTLANYRSAAGARRVVAVVAPGSSAATGRPTPARLAAALATYGGLVIDRELAGGDPRVLAELTRGEGLAVARAIVAEYVPRARRARAVIARRLDPAELAAPAPWERAA